MDFKVELKLYIEGYTMDEESIQSDIRDFNINKILLLEKLEELSIDQLRFLVKSDVFVISDIEYSILETRTKVSSDGNLTFVIILTLKDEEDYDISDDYY